jgi:magnesium chelatase family protein
MVERYLSKVSGPLLDRIDLHVEVTPVEFDQLTDRRKGESSAVIRDRVIAAREMQEMRYKDRNAVFCNAQMGTAEVRDFCTLTDGSLNILKIAMQRLGLSARAYDRILKVARTIADLDNSETIRIEHVSEAIHFRSLDRENWGKKEASHGVSSGHP